MSNSQPIDVWSDARGNHVINFQCDALDEHVKPGAMDRHDVGFEDSLPPSTCVLDLTRVRQCTATGLMALTNLIWRLKLPSTRVIALISSGEVYYLIRESVLNQVMEALPVLPDERIARMTPEAKLQLATQLADGKQTNAPEWVNHPLPLDPGHPLNFVVG